MGVAAALKEWLSGTPATATASLEMVGDGPVEEHDSPRRRRAIYRLPPRTKSLCTISPQTLDDAYKAAQHIKAGSAVFVNLQEIDRASGQRIVDVLSGVCNGVDGTTMRVGDRIFVFAPADYTLTADDRQELGEMGLFLDGFTEAAPPPPSPPRYAEEPPAEMRTGLFARGGFRPAPEE